MHISNSANLISVRMETNEPGKNSIRAEKSGLRSKEILKNRTNRLGTKRDAHRDDGKRFVVRADEKLTAFLELEAAVEPFSASPFF
jgi:hypothetical protein